VVNQTFPSIRRGKKHLREKEERSEREKEKSRLQKREGVYFGLSSMFLGTSHPPGKRAESLCDARVFSHERGLATISNEIRGRLWRDLARGERVPYRRGPGNSDRAARGGGGQEDSDRGKKGEGSCSMGGEVKCLYPLWLLIDGRIRSIGVARQEEKSAPGERETTIIGSLKRLRFDRGEGKHQKRKGELVYRKEEALRHL